MAQQLDHYRLEEIIGVGSFASVYRAVDERLDSTVVVKMLAENHSFNPEIRERFIAEGRSLRRVEGSHVVAIHDIGQSERQQPYLVLEYADRGTLQQRVADLWRTGWRATREDILAFARSLAAAVDSVHRAQLVHRDLSPGNILLTSKPSELIGNEASGLEDVQILREDERVVIADLGMCKDLAMNSGLTVSGGTAGFRPPEQDGPGVVDIRADIWAISGVVKWLAQEADLPKEFHKVIKRGMEPKPARRQRDAAAWLAEIEEALALPEPEPQAVTSAEVAPAPQRRSLGVMGKAVIGVLLIAALALGAGLGYLFSPDDEEQWPATSEEGASLSISGPEEVEVGEEAVFTADVEDLESWVWWLPTGEHVAEEDEVSMVPTSPGSAEVILRARLTNGEELETRHTVRVTE